MCKNNTYIYIIIHVLNFKQKYKMKLDGIHKILSLRSLEKDLVRTNCSGGKFVNKKLNSNQMEDQKISTALESSEGTRFLAFSVVC